MNVTINVIIKYLLNLSRHTCFILIYEKLNVKKFKIIYNLALVVYLNKHKDLIFVSHHEYNKGYYIKAEC